MDPQSFPEDGQEPLQLPDVDARMREIARISADIEEVNRKMEAERSLHPVVEEVENDPEFLEFWNGMSSEEQAEWMRNVRSSLEEHRDEIAGIPGADCLLQRLDSIANHQETLARLADEAQEMVLHTCADEADVSTRLAMSMIEMMTHMENLTDEQWQEMPPAERGSAMDLLNEWNNGQREVILSQLPIEIRRSYE